MGIDLQVTASYFTVPPTRTDVIEAHVDGAAVPEYGETNFG